MQVLKSIISLLNACRIDLQKIRMPFSFKHFIFILMLPVGGYESDAQKAPSPEYQIKATFVFNFAQFSDWPSSAFENEESPFIIGIIGTDPFGSFIDEIVKGETVKGRNIVIKRFKNLGQIEHPHLLFVPRNYNFSDELFALAKEKSIMTVSDDEGFTQKGGMVKFFKENNKVRFEVNLNSAEEAKILFSSKVIRLAEICCN